MKRMSKILILFLAFFLVGCTATMKNIPWNESIGSWTPEQKANFFMETWTAEHQAYKASNAIPDKSDDLIAALKSKREILETSRIPVRTYVSIVKGGGSPDASTEQEIINWLRQMQTQMIKEGVL